MWPPDGFLERVCVKPYTLPSQNEYGTSEYKVCNFLFGNDRKSYIFQSNQLVDLGKHQWRICYSNILYTTRSRIFFESRWI